MSVFGNIPAFNGFGKPSIKLEFDDNEALLEFQKKMQAAGDDSAELPEVDFDDLKGTEEGIKENLGAAGDTYIITDTRTRARKDLEDTALLKKYDIRKFSGEELQKMQTDDPLLYEQIKSDIQQQKTPIKQEVKTKEDWMREVDKMLETWKEEAFRKTTPQKLDEPASRVQARYISNLRDIIIKYFIEEIDKGNYERVSNIANILGYKYAHNERIAQTNGLISQFVGIVSTLPEGWRISKNIPKWLPKLPKGFIYIDNGKEMFDYRHKIMPTQKGLGNLEGYGDLYTVRDNRKRAKKEPGELAANKNLVFTKQRNDIINYNHTLDTAAYKHIDIERNSAFSADKIEWNTKFGFFECLKKSNETEEDNNYYRKGKDGKTYKGTIRHFDVLIDNETELFNIQERYYNKSKYYKADISLSKYNELKNKAFGSFWDSLKRSITYAKNELEKEKKSLYSSEKWVKQAEERLKDAIKIYKYNCNFYGVKNEYENLGKTANNEIYNNVAILDWRGFVPTYQILDDYSDFFKIADSKSTFAGFGLDDTKKLIAETCRQHWRDCMAIAKHLKGDSQLQSCFNLWHWLHYNIRYEYDHDGREEIRTPLRVWQDRARGVDCDCLSVFSWCVLKCMGYNPAFELVAFKGRPQFSHIFVNCDGVVVDRVWFIFNNRPPLITKSEIYRIDLTNDLAGLF